MEEKVKQAFEECERFINECTPEELLEYEKSLNINPKDSVGRKQERIVSGIVIVEMVTHRFPNVVLKMNVMYVHAS